MERDKHQELIDLTWAVRDLIGITDNERIEGFITDDQVQADRNRFPTW